MAAEANNHNLTSLPRRHFLFDFIKILLYNNNVKESKRILEMMTYVKFYLYAKDVFTNEYINISPRGTDGKTIIHLLERWMDSEMDELLMKYFARIPSYIECGPEYTNNPDVEYKYVPLNELRAYEFFKREIVYLHLDFMEHVHKQTNMLYNTDNIFWWDEKAADDFPGLLMPIQYAQLLPEQKQKYTPVIYANQDSEEYVLSMIYTSCRNWLDKLIDAEFKNNCNLEATKIIAEIHW